MNKEILILIIGVFLIPALLTYFIAKVGKLIGILVPLMAPSLSIYTIIETSYYWYGIKDAPMEGGGAPMEGVVYILYGVPATIICTIIWFHFRNRKS